MPYNLDFFNPSHRNFDNIDAFREYFSNISSDCLARASAIAGEDGNFQEAVRVDLDPTLRELQKEAAENEAFRVALAIQEILKTLYESDDFSQLSSSSYKADSHFDNLCTEGRDNSFDYVYSSLRALCLENLPALQVALLVLSLEGGSEKQIEFLVQDLGWNDGQNLNLLVETVNYLLGSELKSQFPMLYRLAGLEQIFTDNKETLLQEAAEIGAYNTFLYLIAANPGLFQETHSLGFNFGHVLAEIAADYGKTKVLEYIISHPDYPATDKSINDKPHLFVLAEIAMENGDTKTFETLLPSMNVLDDKSELLYSVLMKSLIDKDNAKFLNIMLNSEFVVASYDALIARALFKDSASSFYTLLQHGEKKYLSKDEEKLLLVKIASEQNAKKCMMVLEDEFLGEATYALMEELSGIREGRIEGSYDKELEATKGVLSSIIATRGKEAINRKIAGGESSLLSLALTYELVDVAEFLIDTYYQDESLQKQAFEVVDAEGQNLAHLAAMNQDFSFLQKVLKMKGAAQALNVKDKDGDTPRDLSTGEDGNVTLLTSAIDRFMKTTSEQDDEGVVSDDASSRRDSVSSHTDSEVSTDGGESVNYSDDDYNGAIGVIFGSLHKGEEFCTLGKMPHTNTCGHDALDIVGIDSHFNTDTVNVY